MHLDSVRKTWEVNASDVNLRNPKWAKWVQSSILPLCAEKLGIPVYHLQPDHSSRKNCTNSCCMRRVRTSSLIAIQRRHPECSQHLQFVYRRTSKEASSSWSSARSDSPGTVPNHLSPICRWLLGKWDSCTRPALTLWRLTTTGTPT